MNYVVDLEAFHGPLDLLLYLLEEQQLEIYDIPIAVITDQYLEYLQQTEELNLEHIGDFLIMATYLLNLKSRILLPSRVEIREEEEGSDPRAELVQRLLDYKKYKKLAEYLLSRHNGDLPRVFFRDSEDEMTGIEELVGDAAQLWRSFQSFLRDLPDTKEKFKLPQGDVNISEKMEEIVECLGQGNGELILQDLFQGVISFREALAFFLALLELIRLQKVEAVQEKRFGEIKIRLQVAV
ncbi:MAG: segregation/condensation protein A [Syntrophomonas sp.]|uniref:segregation and condensation protein A n=1 Tax=Syntrophomonas sp. TaxID=2053627 RepID=UPI002607B378|nr:segregation/condensation protein A [Syntrophomonas sp.]MDD2510653.1 segregation/condensation protein A [Syntrophomonas sp.]MDD3879703.1 segregation/condensation protein A [Syntrophomonas sp.]MDD4626807.1 segregation/condensation protein A [Syntrophomonas sp.]